jgi:dihydroflavonol-4-reductase
MKALVTGANGHLGYNLCRALIEQGHKVRASIRQETDAAKAAPVHALGDVELVGLDVRNAAALARAVDGVDRLFHVAATFAFYTGSREKDAQMVRDSVEGAENALRAAARAGVEKVVLTSSFVTLPMLGWTPKIPLERSLADTMAAIRALRRKEGRRKMA